MGRILAVNISGKKGTQKQTVVSAEFRMNYGILGDAHAGTWHRQVSLLPVESVRTLEGHGLDLSPGVFAENILTEGLALTELPIGTRLALGESVLLEVTQIGKECHHGCIIRQVSGTCVMPTDGVFARVLRGGTVTCGDEIAVVNQNSTIAISLFS